MSAYSEFLVQWVPTLNFFVNECLLWISFPMSASLWISFPMSAYCEYLSVSADCEFLFQLAPSVNFFYNEYEFLLTMRCLLWISNRLSLFMYACAASFFFIVRLSLYMLSPWLYVSACILYCSTVWPQLSVLLPNRLYFCLFIGLSVFLSVFLYFCLFSVFLSVFMSRCSSCCLIDNPFSPAVQTFFPIF